MKSKVAKRAFLLFLIFLLILPLGISNARERVDQGGKRGINAKIPVDSLQIPAGKRPSVYHHDRKWSAKKEGITSPSPFHAEKREALSPTANEDVKPFNYVPASTSGEKITVIVELKSEPLAVQRTKAEKDPLKSFAAGKAQLEREQTEFSAAVKKLKAGIRRSYKEVFNGFSLSIPANQVERLLSLPGVKAIYPNHKVFAAPLKSITPNMDESAPFIGAQTYWDQGIDGTGIKVGVIDTGVDYRHPSLRDAYKRVRFRR
ncbi:exported hypothetical protein [[Clostridium] ultunense Esp]|nr:exported hypothetical protein [[Clostridium] ultunense Esp]